MWALGSRAWGSLEYRCCQKVGTRLTSTPQVSTTVETFQDLSLPIPGKEDLAKLHSAIYQNAPAKPGACGDSSATQGWLAFIVEYIRRCTYSPQCQPPGCPGRDRGAPGRPRGEVGGRGLCKVRSLALGGVPWTP